MKLIPLSQGKFAKVDDDDFDWLNQWKWYCLRGYAVREYTVNGQKRYIRMHKEILRPPVGMYSDHIDGDKANNQRQNLRVCTTAENMCNRGKQSNNTSGYKGVSWIEQTRKWRAQIWVNNKRIHLGVFSSPHDAATVYDVAAVKYHGEYAKTNY